MGGRGADNGDLEKSSSDSLDFSKDKDIWAYRHNPNDGKFVNNINTTITDTAGERTEDIVEQGCRCRRRG